MKNNKAIIVGLVDDDKVFQFITGKIFRTINFIEKLLQFENGQELLNYLTLNFDKSENLPDIIFLDIQMPFMDGWQFLDEYSNLKLRFVKEIKIYILSSSINLNDKEKAKTYSQISGYFVKPIEKKDYLKILQGNYQRSSA